MVMAMVLWMMGSMGHLLYMGALFAGMKVEDSRFWEAVFLAAGVEVFYCLAEFCAVDMGVDLGGGDVGVA